MRLMRLVARLPNTGWTSMAPRTAFVARFVGGSSELRGRVREQTQHGVGKLLVVVAGDA